MTCLLAVTTLLPIDERRRDQRVGGLVAAHQLDDDVDPVIGDEVGRGVGHELRRQARGRATARVADADRDQPERRAIGRLELVTAVEQRPDDLASRRVPAPSTPTRSRAPLMTGDGRVATSVRMVADASGRERLGRPVTVRASTTRYTREP